MNRELPVGFFDSGVGGLSVYARFKELLPNENTIYFGDLKNMPYGNKTKDELIGFAKKILDFYNAKNVKAVIIACNTSSAVAYEELKNDYDFKIYPIIQMCAEKVACLGLKTVGVFATAATINSNAYKNELKKYAPDINVVQVACPNWTTWVEAGMQESAEARADISEKVADMIVNKPDKIILGCTHYPYLMNVLKDYTDENIFLDPAIIFSNAIKDDLTKLNLINISHAKGNEKFYVSANPQAFVKNSKQFYSVPDELVLQVNI